MKIAIDKDKEGNVSAAVKHYMLAIEYFVPAIHCKWLLFDDQSLIYKTTI